MNETQTEMDITRKYARLIERRKDGFVEFEFAIGEPELFVEMVLPNDAYEAFCRQNQVELLPSRDETVVSDWEWRLHEASHQRFR